MITFSPSRTFSFNPAFPFHSPPLTPDLEKFQENFPRDSSKINKNMPLETLRGLKGLSVVKSVVALPRITPETQKILSFTLLLDHGVHPFMEECCTKGQILDAHTHMEERMHKAHFLCWLLSSRPSLWI